MVQSSGQIRQHEKQVPRRLQHAKLPSQPEAVAESVEQRSPRNTCLLSERLIPPSSCSAMCSAACASTRQPTSVEYNPGN